MIPKNILIYFGLVLFTKTIVNCNGQLPKMPNIGSTKERQKSEKLPPCSSCKKLITSFNLGLEKTARGKHEGGDAIWEEEKLRSYKTSEVRLVEIQENLCRDVGRGEDQCHRLAENNEEIIEEWWFNYQIKFPDFFKWFCVDKLKVCCLENHFGPNCEPCSSCFGNGRCRGNNTRLGDGKCACDVGYTGQNCEQCDLIHYEAFRDESKLLCVPCSNACGNEGCFGAGPKSCRTCRSGWIMDSDSGCVDLNECGSKTNPCTSNQFCVNNEGSYSCLDCDKSCVECTGDGPDLCRACADNYELREGICTDLEESNSEMQKDEL